MEVAAVERPVAIWEGDVSKETEGKVTRVVSERTSSLERTLGEVTAGRDVSTEARGMGEVGDIGDVCVGETKDVMRGVLGECNSEGGEITCVVLEGTSSIELRSVD